MTQREATTHGCVIGKIDPWGPPFVGSVPSKYPVLASELECLHTQLGTSPIDTTRVADALRRVRRASDAVDPQFTADSNFRASVRQSYAANRALNESNRAHWAAQSQTATHDSAAAVRPRSIAEINASNRGFWADRAAVTRSTHPVEQAARGRR